MQLEDKIKELPTGLKAGNGVEVIEWMEEIEYYFSKLEQFEMLKLEPTGDPNKMIIGACMSTLPDPFFKIVVAHTWQSDLAFDEQWSEFETTEMGTVFRFVTWDDSYLAGEIWFQRVKHEKNNA